MKLAYFKSKETNNKIKKDNVFIRGILKNKIIKLIYLLTIIIIIFACESTVYADDVDDEEDYDILQELNENYINEVSKNIETEPVTNSRKCIIYDRTSKTVLYGKNENVKGAMASTTKIMTATVILENADITEEIEISAKAGGTGGSRLGLKKGDKITINDLLYGLMLRSGNDAAVALAEHVGGSIEGFAEMMNKKAEELGLKNTHFVTPHGLDNSEHYTTAYELAKLTDYALQNEKFATIVGTKTTTIYVNGSPRQIANTNELLGTLNGVIGVKTGFTNNAGRCLVTEAKRDDMDIITVVLGADTKKYRTQDSIKLIEYSFSNFKMVNIKEKIIDEFNEWKNINANRIEIIKGHDCNLGLALGGMAIEKIPLKDSEIDKIEYDINTLTIMKAPIEKWSKIGTIKVKLNGKIIESIDIINTNPIYKKTWIDYFKKALDMV